MQALMLAAGMGRRLGKFTNNNTKCMVEVAGEKLIDRAIESIRLAGIKKFILVIGYEGQNLKNYILDNYSDIGMEFVFIDNVDYATSNNIYSFYLAKEYMLQDDTLLLESDLIFDKALIKKVVDSKDDNIVTVAKYESWMDGTVVTIDKENFITQFIDKLDMDIKLLDTYYKTVNVYKFSKEFFKQYYLPFLQAYMTAYGLNSYYETVLKVLSHISNAKMKAFYMDNMPWYEIDDAQDLDIATVLFSTGKAKYDNIMSKFGGYWRYNKVIDFCYLVNPYFPPKQMVEKLQNEYPILLTQYPSGLKIQNLNAERVFEVDDSMIIAGNGAAELINTLGLALTGKVGVGLPTFNEYVRCFRNCELVKIDNTKWDYKHNLTYLKELAPSLDTIMVINPDNPSGFLLKEEEILELIRHCKDCNTKIVIDESFIDFSKSEERYTLLNNDILKEFDNLIVVKSISKSYGVPGLRLGVLATSDDSILTSMKALMPVWNINSFGEYYLQVYNLFAKDYSYSCDKIVEERKRMIDKLRKIKNIKVYDSSANYIMIDLQNYNSYDFCVKMLSKNNILIKDLSTKSYFNGKNMIRVAVRDEHDNNIFLQSIEKELGI